MLHMYVMPLWHTLILTPQIFPCIECLHFSIDDILSLAIFVTEELIYPRIKFWSLIIEARLSKPRTSEWVVWGYKHCIHKIYRSMVYAFVRWQNIHLQTRRLTNASIQVHQSSLLMLHIRLVCMFITRRIPG